MSEAQKHLALLGYTAKDKVTGFKGVVTSISFELYGCIQILVHPGMGAEGKIAEQQWFDVSRLELVSDVPVMDQPNFVEGHQARGEQGADNKPIHGRSI
jgi:hypothetical protein